VWVENRSDDLWLGVKGLSSWQIAGSPRNSFWASLWLLACGGRATEWDMGPNPVPYLIKLRIPCAESRVSVCER
jgi:hypothetical protein